MYGFLGVAQLWFKSFLTNRHQKCNVDGNLSQAQTLHCGAVLQGSNLGLLLFLVYIKDLQKCLKYSSPRIYAYDTNITIKATSTSRAQMITNHNLYKLLYGSTDNIPRACKSNLRTGMWLMNNGHAEGDGTAKESFLKLISMVGNRENFTIS